jgi:cardiolipin synthase
MWCTLDKNTYITFNILDLGEVGIPLIGLIILLVAATSDLFDGWIARKFNQTSDLGAALDPIADKLMHVTTLLSLVILGFVHWAFLVAILLKEALMILGGLFLLKYSTPIKANMTGKIASVVLSIGVCMSFFHPLFRAKVFYLDWIVIGVAVIITYVAFFGYLHQAIPHFKVMIASLKNKLDPNDVFGKMKTIRETEGMEDVNYKEVIASLKEEKKLSNDDNVSTQ